MHVLRVSDPHLMVLSHDPFGSLFCDQVVKALKGESHSNGVSGARGGGRPLLDAGSKDSMGFSGGDRDLWAPGWMQHI